MNDSTRGFDPSRRSFLRGSMGAGAALCLGLPGLVAGCARNRPRARSVVLVTVDTLRADHLGCYGYARDTSPCLDAFARDALLFERCSSHAPVTGSSCASILSGFLPHETKVYENLPLPAAVPTIAPRVQRAGLRTGAVVSNNALQVKRGWARGFDRYDHALADVEVIRGDPERIAAGTTDGALALLQQFGESPYFLWVHYQDPHGPYTPPEDFAKLFADPSREPRRLRINRTVTGRGGIPSYQKLGDHDDYHYYVDRYDAEIRYFDAHFERLVRALEELGRLDETLIVFTADHGEGMGERDYFFAHGEYLYASLTHVPLIVKHGTALRGRRSEFVQHIDIAPTILRAIGVSSDLPFRGRDLRGPDVAAAEIHAEMRSRHSQDRVQLSLIRDGFKLIATPLASRYELFDLEADRREEYDLAADPAHAERRRAMARDLAAAMREDRLGLVPENPAPAISESERRMLENLGYIE